MLMDRRRRKMKNTGIELVFIPQDCIHNTFISLRKQTAPTIKNRRSLRRLPLVVNQESPITIMPVKIPKQGIDDKHIPKVFF